MDKYFKENHWKSQQINVASPLKFLPIYAKNKQKGVAPPTQDATLPTDKIGVGEKICFFYLLLQGIDKMSNQSNHMRIFNYERTIEELVNHHIQKYKYVGEKGKEYEVIQSIFYEINQLPELSNQQIRWYSIIIYLVRSFYDHRNRSSFPGFSLPESVNGFKVLTNVEKDKPLEFVVPSPPFIERIELYITEIARMGVLVSSKKEINSNYFDYKLERIGSLLTELLNEMDSQMKRETQEEVFILTIRNAGANVIKLFKIKNRKNPFTKSINSKIYGKLIIKRIKNIDKNRLADYYNMEAFWNGFIP